MSDRQLPDSQPHGPRPPSPCRPVPRLRDATPDDLELSYAITEAAMRSHVEQTAGGWDAQAQRKAHLATYTPASHQIIMVADAAAGLIAAEHFPSYVWLVKLYLLPGYQGLGIGSALLAELLAHAHQQRKQVTLQVLKDNLRAQALYARHGFKITAQRPQHLFMASLPA